MIGDDFILQITNLSLSLKKDQRRLVRGLSLSLQSGDKAVLIGEEGNGKSTFLKLLYNESLVSDYAEWEGAIVKNGTRCGYLPQELSPAECGLSVYDFLCDRALFERTNARELAKASAELGISTELLYEDRAMGSLSGGERVKVQLCALLLEEPDVLLLDEPSNDIDIETLSWLERFIIGCGRPVIFISHDETLIASTANMVIHFEQIRRKTVPRHTVARLPYEQYISERLSGLSHQEQVAKWEQTEHREKVERWQQIYRKVKHDQAAVSRGDPHGGFLLKKKMASVKAQERRFGREEEALAQMPDAEETILPKFAENLRVPAGKTVLELSLPALSAGGKVLSQNLFLRVNGGEHVCIVGKNGAGKTTLLRLIANELLLRPDLNAAYMPQDYSDSLDFSVTPVAFLAPSGKKEDITRARTFLGSMKYTADEMEHTAASLSGGQKAKLLFLDMILRGCNVLILDEPTRNFSPLSNPVIRQVLREYPGSIISVSHDRKYIGEVCPAVYSLTSDGLVRSL